MTLKCNLVTLWECPQWVAEMCVQGTENLIEITSKDGDWSEVSKPQWALERYLKWLKGTHSTIHSRVEKHIKEVESIMNNPNLKVRIE